MVDTASLLTYLGEAVPRTQQHTFSGSPPNTEDSVLTAEKLLNAIESARVTDTLGEWMRLQGYPPERSLLLLPLSFKVDQKWYQDYVRFSPLVKSPTLMADITYRNFEGTK